MTLDEFHEAATVFMDSHTTMTLATSVDGEPWAAAVFYARRGYELVFFSSPGSRHSRAIAESEKVAAAIHGDYSNWRDIKGLQMEGTARKLDGPIEVAKATATYLRRYPFVSQFLKAPETISEQVIGKMSDVSLYVFQPESIRYLDNSAGFGVRWSIRLESGRPCGEPVRD